jgi:preprotein translocase subunit YajC
MYLLSLSFLADAAAAPGAGNGAGGLLGSPVVPLVAMVVIFYFLLIRPQQKKQKELQSLVSSLKTGDKVVTQGGIHGIVSNVKDGSTLSLKIADNVKIEVDKTAIVTVDRGNAPAPAAVVKA